MRIMAADGEHATLTMDVDENAGFSIPKVPAAGPDQSIVAADLAALHRVCPRWRSIAITASSKR
jgi:hypothetical protein